MLWFTAVCGGLGVGGRSVGLWGTDVSFQLTPSTLTVGEGGSAATTGLHQPNMDVTAGPARAVAALGH